MFFGINPNSKESVPKGVTSKKRCLITISRCTEVIVFLLIFLVIIFLTSFIVKHKDKRHYFTGKINREKFPLQRKNAKKDNQPLWTIWSEWSQCTKTCGNDGIQSRTSYCLLESAPSKRCKGRPYVKSTGLWNMAAEHQPCNNITCNNKILPYLQSKNMEIGIKKSNISHSRVKRQGQGGYSVAYTFVLFDCFYGKRLQGIFKGTTSMSLCFFPDGTIDEVQDKTLTVCSYSSYTDLLDRQIFAADFDGDGLDDIGCYNNALKEFQVYLNRDEGFSKAWSGQIVGCDKKSNGNLHVGDINGDGRADLVCGSTASNAPLTHIYYNGE